ncbi:MAG: prolyl oligopeptidase family serine peptidase [Brevundimonas sp.]|jgi:dipeptidyl aminopeptidase/acylaminoacyl peptidase|uniref:S9 family peptidase n=1 Tax=Brevundimonas sp. TaxID=1871086 RepID=UPI0025C0CDA2|nr:prolyl oligopeptidase family serine peptidase [Brevundimonas sp.]MCH4269658.1 prolyl oligopeptidase family serine peptidase [Brevundimonas sp.]
MFVFFTRLAGATIMAACLSASAFAQGSNPSRPLAVNDITRLASFGRGAVSPDGRWAVYEKRGAYDSIPRFEYEWRSTWTVMNLWLADIHNPGAAPAPLIPEEGPGLQRVAWSPSGAHLLVSRLRDRKFELGVVSMADRSVRWTGLTPDVPRTGASAEWVSTDAVLVLVRPDHSLPESMRYQGGSPMRITAAWERTARGREPSRTVVDARAGVMNAEVPSPTSTLVLINVADGSARTLAEGRINDFAVSPDRRQIAIVQSGEGAAMATREVVQFERGERQRLSIITLADGREVWRMAGRDVAPHLLRWSPDSRAVLVWARQDGASWADGDLVQAASDGVTSMNLDGLTTGSSTETVLGVHADWLGDRPVLYARARGGSRFDWHILSPTTAPRPLTTALKSVPGRLAAAGRHELQLFADGGYWSLRETGLHRLTPNGMSMEPAIASDQELVTRLKVNEAPRRDWAVAQGAKGGTQILMDDGRRRQLGTATGPVGRVLAVSPEAILFLRRTGLSEALYLRTLSGERPIDAVNEDLKTVKLVEPRPVTHQDIDGRETRSWLFLPDEGTPIRGVVVRVYPGSTDSHTWFDPLTLTYGFRPQVLAAAGFAVLSPSMPDGRIIASRGDDFVRGVDLAVDAALAAYPQLPADRMAVMGHSFGGYAALEIAARSTRYRSYVASSAFSDMFGMWGEFDPATRIFPEDGGRMRASQGWTEAGQGKLAAPPWEASDAYAASSPYLIANRITAPVMLLTADMDFVPLSQAERMFSAILRNGGQARLVTYWGERHILWSPANIRDRFAQIFNWLDLTLAPINTAGQSNLGGVPTVEPIPRAPPPP